MENSPDVKGVVRQILQLGRRHNSVIGLLCCSRALAAALVQNQRRGRRWGNVPLRSGCGAVRRSPFRCGDSRVVRSVVLELQAELPRLGQHDERGEHEKPGAGVAEFAE